MPTSLYPSVCGHRSGQLKLVQYSSHESGITHTICSPCLKKDTYYVTPIENPEVDIAGGSVFVSIPLTGM